MTRLTSISSTPTVPRRPKYGQIARAEAIAGYLFISPWAIGFLVFLVGPMLASLFLSFCRYPVLQPPVWIGLENYRTALLQDNLVGQALKVSGLYSMATVPLGLVTSFLVALMLNQKVRGLGIYRSAYYLPVLIPAVVAALIFGWLVNPEFGLINAGLALVGIPGPLWLASVNWALPALVILSLWGIGGPMLIYLAGFQGIPTELYDAASIDGANALAQFLNVTLPMVTPVVFFNLIMGIVGSFQSFTSAYVLTQGGPENATLFYLLYLYDNAFQNFRMGYAAALAWILFVIVLLLSLLALRSSEAWVYYEGQVKGKR